MMQVDKFLHQRKSDTAPDMLIVNLIKSLEYTSLFISRNASAGVGYFNAQIVFCMCGSYRDASDIRIFECI